MPVAGMTKTTTRFRTTMIYQTGIPMVEHIGEIASQIASVANQTTSGSFSTEEHAVAELDRIIEQSGLFRIHREVRGRYVNGRPNVEETQPRIDRILIPK